jgi:hypothetical protein
MLRVCYIVFVLFFVKDSLSQLAIISCNSVALVTATETANNPSHRNL